MIKDAVAKNELPTATGFVNTKVAGAPVRSRSIQTPNLGSTINNREPLPEHVKFVYKTKMDAK